MSLWHLYLCVGYHHYSSVGHSMSLKKMLSSWCLFPHRHFTCNEQLTRDRAAPNFLSNSSKHTGFSVQNPELPVRFSLFLPFTHKNWTEMPAKSCLYWNTAMHCDCRRSCMKPPAHGKIFPQSIQRPSRVLETQKTQTEHTAETTALSCARSWYDSKKPSSVLSGALGNVLRIENHKNNQHTHLNPNKPICTEPVKPPLRASVIPYIWFTFFRKTTEALQLVPKAQWEAENPQYT